MAQPPWSTTHHAADDSWYAELEQLVQRYERGEITDDQFSLEKQHILRKSRRGQVHPEQLQIVIAVFDVEQEARSVYGTLVRLQDDDMGFVVDTAVLLCDTAGAVHLTEQTERSPRTGMRRGALIGVLASLIFPQTFISGRPSRATQSALISYLTDHGFGDHDLRLLGLSLQPGNSAVFTVSHTRWAGQLAGYLRTSTGISSYPLPGEIVTLVTASVDVGRPLHDS